MKYICAKKIKKAGVPVLILTLSSMVFFLPVSAAPGWNTEEGSENTQGDQKKTGKNETDGEATVYGAIGNLDDKYSMDIDGDGTADVTIPQADLIEVAVTPSVVVNIYLKPTDTGEKVQTKSSEGTIQNQNLHNSLKVSLQTLEGQNNNTGQIKVTDDLEQNAEDGLSLSIYAQDVSGNAFAVEGETLGTTSTSLANTAQNPPVPITLGTLSPKGESLSYGTYLFQSDCRRQFIEKYENKPITYKAVYKFTIQN